MKFLFLTLGYHPEPVGGGYRHVRDLAERLASEGDEIHVITPSTRHAPIGTSTVDGVQVHRYQNEHGPFWRNWLRENESAKACCNRVIGGSRRGFTAVTFHAFLRRAVPRSIQDRLHVVHGPWPDEYLFRQSGLPRSWVKRTVDALLARIMREEERCALASASRVLVMSQSMRRFIENQYSSCAGKTVLMRGAVNLERFSPMADRAAARSEWGIESGTTLFLALRRLEARMGLGVLLDAFAQISESAPSAQLWIAGEGPQRAELEASAARLDGGARLLGLVPEAKLRSLLNAADCSIVPSLALEGFGLATAESLACGTPVLGSNAGATPELLEPLDHRMVFQAGSTTRLVVLLREVLEEKIVLPTREACRDYAERNFDWQEPVRVFRAALANSPNPATDRGL